MEIHVIQNQETFSLQSEHYNIDRIVVSDAVKCISLSSYILTH